MDKEEEERRIREHMNRNQSRNHISVSSDNLSFAYNLGKEMQRSEYTIFELTKQVSNLTQRLDIIENTKTETIKNTEKDAENRFDEDYKSFEGIEQDESQTELRTEHDIESDESAKSETKEEEDVDYDDANAQPVFKNSKEYTALKVISENVNCCTHDIARVIGCTAAYASVLVGKLLKKSRIKKTEKTSCSESDRSHDKYVLLAPINYLIKDTGKKKLKKTKKKVKPHGWMMKDTKVGRVLKCISEADSKEGICAHAVADKLKIDAKDASRSIGYWVSRGRITQLEKEDVCPDSRRLHKFYKITEDVTDDMFLDMKKETAELEQKKHEQKMAIITKELDLDSYDTSGTYRFRDIMQSINEHKKEFDMQYTSFIGQNAIREGFDKNWKNLEKALDRLEQDNLVVHKSAYGTGYSSWKMTQLGYRKLMGYNTEETSDDARRDKESEDALDV